MDLELEIVSKNMDCNCGEEHMNSGMTLVLNVSRSNIEYIVDLIGRKIDVVTWTFGVVTRASSRFDERWHHKRQRGDLLHDTQ